MHFLDIFEWICLIFKIFGPILVILGPILNIFVQLGPRPKPKALAQRWTLNSLSNHHPPPPPPKTFQRVLGIVGGQDLVCSLLIVQATRLHSFDPPPLQIFWSKRYFWPNFLGPKIFVPKKFWRVKILVQKILWSKQNILVRNVFFGPIKKCWSEKKVLSERNFFGPNKFWSKQIFGPNKFLVQKKFWSEKKLQWKIFCLKKFFGPKKF